ncbi:MAG: hypothetical protein WAL09_07880, partial [Pseudolabrys sp.]
PQSFALGKNFYVSKSNAEPFQKTVREGRCDVRFTPESGHVQCNSACPLCANSGHGHLPPFKAASRDLSHVALPRVLVRTRFYHSAIGGTRTQHSLSDSRNRSSRHLAKFFLSSTD